MSFACTNLICGSAGKDTVGSRGSMIDKILININFFHDKPCDSRKRSLLVEAAARPRPQTSAAAGSRTAAGPRTGKAQALLGVHRSEAALEFTGRTGCRPNPCGRKFHGFAALLRSKPISKPERNG